MPTALRLFGFQFFYWSKDHTPIHVHVRKGGTEARFVIEPVVELIENNGMKSHDLALAEEIVRENREFLVEHWNLYFGKK
jgi:hypothetical protein